VKIRVLVVDDHKVVRDGLRMILEAEQNMTVVGEAGNGNEALRLAAELGPHVVVMDISMPELNGLEATERLRELRPGIKILVLSMHGDAEYIARAFSAGANGYVLKDSAADVVVDAVREVCDGRRYLSEDVKESVVDDYFSTHHHPRDTRSPLETLTTRERQILQLVAEDRSSAEIGEAVGLSPKTVDSYRSRLMQKLGVRSAVGLARFALAHGLVRIP
jgi:DNA-binding NarL/FixJ family response regulator